MAAGVVLAGSAPALAGTVTIDDGHTFVIRSLGSPPFTYTTQYARAAGTTTHKARFESETEVGASLSMDYEVTGFVQIGSGVLGSVYVEVVDTLTFAEPAGASLVEFDFVAHGVIQIPSDAMLLSAYSHIGLNLTDALTGASLFSDSSSTLITDGSQSGFKTLHLHASVPVVQSMAMRWELKTLLGTTHWAGVLPGGSYTLVNDFYSTAVLGPVRFTDAAGNTVAGGTVTSSTGRQYEVAVESVPLPSAALLGFSLITLVGISSHLRRRASATVAQHD